MPGDAERCGLRRGRARRRLGQRRGHAQLGTVEGEGATAHREASVIRPARAIERVTELLEKKGARRERRAPKASTLHPDGSLQRDVRTEAEVPTVPIRPP